jgi:hypothetical protein
MAYILTDFEDIYTAVCEELKVPLTDGTTLARIKRDINMIYLNHVVPYKPRSWDWLVQRENIVTYEKIETGTVTVTADSTTISLPHLRVVLQGIISNSKGSRIPTSSKPTPEEKTKQP